MIRPAIATLVNGRIERRRAEGKLANLAARLDREPVQGAIGIGHTRWATHGQPTETNAHPIATDRVAVVHNGIIENFQALRRELERARLRLPDPDRYRGGGDPGDALPRRRGCRRSEAVAQDAGAARRRLRARLSVRRRARPADRRPARQPAGDRLWRRRDVSRLRRPGAGAADPPHHLSRRRRLGGRDLARRCTIFDADNQRGRAADPRIRRLGRADRQGQLPPFHAEGDLRAAGGDRRHAERAGQPGDPHRPSARICRSRSPRSSG